MPSRGSTALGPDRPDSATALIAEGDCRDEGVRPVESIRGATTVASDLATVATGRAALALLSAVSVLITTRMLGPAGYGTVALAGIIATLVYTVTSSWTGVSVRRYGREDLELRGTMSRLTWNRAIIGMPLAVVSIAAVIALKIFGGLPSAVTWPLVWIVIASALTTIVLDHWVCLLETSGRMRLSAVSQVVTQAVYVAILFAIFTLRGHGTPVLILAFGLGTQALLSLALVPFLWSLGLVPLAADRPLLRRMLRLSTPLIGFTVSQYVFASIDILVLRIFRSQADVGVYAVAYQAYTVLSRVAVSATAVFVPLFVSLELAGRRKLIERYLERGVPQGLLLIALAGGVAIPLLPSHRPHSLRTRLRWRGNTACDPRGRSRLPLFGLLCVPDPHAP